MARNKYLLLLLFSIALTATTRHFHVEHYRKEMGFRQTDDGLALIQQRAGAYIEDESSEHASASAEIKTPPVPVCGCGHDHDHKHHHVTGMALTNTDHDFKKPAAKVQDEKTAHQVGHEHHSIDEHQEEHEHHSIDEQHAQHEHSEEHEEHAHHEHAAQDPAISPGFALLLRQLGFAELAANILWIQMDADSHRGLWHRVEVALELIPALDPTFVDAYLLRSFLLDSYQGKHDEALQILENAVKQVPYRVELWQQIGIFCLNHSGRHGSDRRLQRALEAFQQMSQFVDSPPQAPRLIAVTLAVMERRDEAIQVLQKSATDPNRESNQQSIDLQMIERIRSGEKF